MGTRTQRLLSLFGGDSHAVWVFLHQHRRAAILAALFALIGVSYLPAYNPVVQSLELHIQEAKGTAPWQIAARQKEKKEKDDAASKKAKSDAQDKLLVSQYQRLAKEFMDQQDALNETYQSMNNVRMLISAHYYSMAHNKDTYEKDNYSIELASGRKGCDYEIYDDDANTAFIKNVIYCELYLNSMPNPLVVGFDEDFLIGALASRYKARLEHQNDENIDSDTDFNQVPLDKLLLVAWQKYYLKKVTAAEIIDPLPPLVEGDYYNGELFSHVIRTKFGTILMQTASVTEKIKIKDSVYPRLEALQLAASQLSAWCQQNHINPCLKSAQ